MSTREDELQAVKERIEAFCVKLRGRDSGGDDRKSRFALFTVSSTVLQHRQGRLTRRTHLDLINTRGKWGTDKLLPLRKVPKPAVSAALLRLSVRVLL